MRRLELPMGSVRQLPYFAGGRMFLFKVLYSLESSESPLVICLVLGRIGLSQDVNATSLLDFGETEK